MRAKHEGSVYELPNGKWRAQVNLGGGKYVRRNADTKSAAAKLLRNLQTERDSGIVVRGDLTVSALIDEWIQLDETGNDRTRGTIVSNRGHLDHWRKHLGTRRVATIDVPAIEAAMAAMSAGRVRPYTRETLTKRLSVLGQVFDAAIRRGRISVNPVRLARLPRNAAKTAKREAFTPEQANELIRATATRRNGAAYLLGLSLGLRPGELYGLQWNAVDFDRGTIHIHRAVQMDTGRPIISDSLKTTGSLRTLALPAFVADGLRDHRDRQLTEDRPEGWTDRDLVFPNDLGGPMDLGVVRDWFAATAKSLGFGDGWTPNQMRHTAASLLADRGVPLETIASILGHTTTRMVEKYYRSAYRPERDGHVAAMDEVFAGSTKRKRKLRVVS